MVILVIPRITKKAKLSKDFATADKIRNELKAQGIELIDKKDGGTDWIQN